MPTAPLDDLAEARAKIEATREALQAALDGQEAPEPVRRAITRLERLAAEVERIELAMAIAASEAAATDPAYRTATERQAVPSLPMVDSEMAGRLADFGLSVRQAPDR